MNDNMNSFLGYGNLNQIGSMFNAVENETRLLWYITINKLSENDETKINK